MTSSPVLLAVIAFLFVGGGVLIGLALGRGNAKLAQRCQDLEHELDAARGEFADYRRQVGQHFDQTGALLRAMTLQYRTVYEHLADGARTLCPDQATSLEAGSPEPLLGSGGAARADAPAAEAAHQDVPGADATTATHHADPHGVADEDDAARPAAAPATAH